MELNESCVRDVLIFCKNNIDYKELSDGTFHVVSVSLQQLFNSYLNNSYSHKEIMYTVLKLNEVNFIKISNRNPENSASYINNCMINEITYSGHKFLAATEPETVWNKTKGIIGKVGNHTLEFVENVAHDVAVESAKALVSK